MKTLMVCIGKLENKYIRHWVEYYKGLGFSKIVLCDNNAVEGERFEEVIDDYIKSGYVIIEDYRGKECQQYPAYESCYRKYGSEYDWLAFFDVDEYLTIVDGKNITEYLSQSIFDKFSLIKINWLCYGDNNIIEPEYDKPVTERFSEPVEPKDIVILHTRIPENYHVKAIIRGGLNNVKFPTAHNPQFEGEEGHVCDTMGRQLVNNTPFKQITYEGAYIKHYVTKTIYEYVNKIRRGDVVAVIDDSRRIQWAKKFFCYNIRTPEKEKIFKDELGFDI